MDRKGKGTELFLSIKIVLSLFIFIDSSLLHIDARVLTYQRLFSIWNIYISKIPTIQAINNPTITGIKLRLTRSTGLTPETPESAATPKAQAAKVPPPTKIPATWPKDAKIATFKPGAVPTAADNAPVKGKPEKPEPSNPPSIPTKAIPNDVIIGLSPRLVAISCPQSNRKPGVPSPNIAPAFSGLPK